MPVPEQKKELDAFRRTAATPPALQGKTDEEALAYLRSQKERRAALQSRIATLQKRRDAYLATMAGTAHGFDEQVVQSLRSLAARAGFKL